MRRSTTGVPPWSIAMLAMVLIQLASALSVEVIGHAGAAGTAFLRMGLGAMLLVLIVRPKLRAIPRRDWPVLLALGAVTGLMTLFFLSALDRIPLGTAVSIEFLGPLLLAAIMSPRRSALVWPALAFVGVVLMTEPWTGAIDLLGIGFALLAGTCWALYNLFTQKVGDRYSGISGLAVTIPIAAGVTAVFGLPEVVQAGFDGRILLLAIGIALLTPVASFSLEMVALRRMTHTAFGTLLAVEPAIAVVLGLIVLAQMPHAPQIVGIILVALAGVLAQRGGTRGAITQ